jgi:hypothetical protein
MRAGLLCLLGVMTPACGSSPDAVIRGAATCAECTIERYLLATIHDSAFQGGALLEVSEVFVTRDTTFFVLSDLGLTSELFKADRTGRIVSRVGRTGGGPGEFTKPRFVMETPSSYLVLDVRLNRVTHLAKSDLALQGTREILALGPIIGSFPVAFDDGSFVIESISDLGDAARKPLHIFSAEGERLRSFGIGDSTRKDRILAPGGPVLSRDGGLWLAEYNRYRVEKWDRDGNLVDVIERETEWFPWPAPEPAAGQRFATLGGVGQDEDGLLWTHIAMRPRIERRLPDGGTRLGVDPDPSHAETIIEVFDPARRTLLASTRMAGWASYAAAGGFYQVEYDASPSGEPLIRVWAYRLRR